MVRYMYRIEIWRKVYQLVWQSECEYEEHPDEDPLFEEESGWYQDINKCKEFGIKRASGKKLLKEAYIKSGHSSCEATIYLRIYSDKRTQITEDLDDVDLIHESKYDFRPHTLFEKKPEDNDYITFSITDYC